MSNDILKIGRDFSVTEKLQRYIGNPTWREGYEKVQAGDLVYDDEGRIDLKSLPAYASLWTTISAAFEDVGSREYERIRNLQKSARDADYCTIHALASIAEELDAENVQLFDIAYPLEIENLVNVFSVQEGHALLYDYLLNDTTLDTIWSTASDVLTGMMDGYVLSADSWTEDQETYISELSSNYLAISLSAWIDTMEAAFSAVLIDNITLDGIVNDFKASLETNPTYDPYSAAPDTDEIENLKLQYGVPKSFHAAAETDLVEIGTTTLKDYSTNEQTLIETEQKNRAERTKYGSDLATFKRFQAEKERKVRAYISFVENINVYDADYIVRDDLFVVSGTPLSFFDDVGGVPVSGELITNTVHMLRNICLRVSYQREYLKRMAQKHALVGTSRLLQTIISEYIARNFSSPDYWGYHTFPEISSPFTAIEELDVIQELSARILGDIRVIEYWDTTEYMNISAVTDVPDITPDVNDRYWEGLEGELSELLSQNTEAEISGLFSQLGLTNMTSEEIIDFLEYTYDMGATSATMFPTFSGVAFSIPTTGTYGTYGSYTVSGTTVVYDADIAPVTGYVVSTYYSDWISSPFLDGRYSTSAEFLTEWLATPNADTWIDGVTVTTDEADVEVDNTTFYFSNTDLVEPWVQSEYGTSGWIETEITPIWRDSDLISRLSLDQFKDMWDQATDVSLWTTYDAVSAPVSPFDDLDWAHIPEYLTWLEDEFDGGPLTSQAQWISSEFVRSWVNAPFVSGVADTTFEQEIDWAVSGNPFVSGWILGDPFEVGVTNSDLIEGSASFSSEIELAEFMAGSGMIPDSESGFNGPLSGMWRKYAGEPSGTFPPANIKEEVHPSIAYQPYLYNLVKVINDLVLFENVYAPVTVDVAELSAMIDELGAPINSWRKDHVDLTGYQTYYEYSPNLDAAGEENERIDVDGPWYPPALSALLSNGSDIYGTWYDHLGLSTAEEAKVRAQLQAFSGDIAALSEKRIYQYSTDKYNNHYMLYKEDELFDTSGVLWMRYNNHPLAFPAFDADSQLSQIDISDVSTSTIEEGAAKAYDFAIENVGSRNIFWLYGENVAGSGYFYSMEANSSDSGQYDVAFSKWPNGYNKTLIDNTTHRFVGAYANYNDLVLVRIEKEQYQYGVSTDLKTNAFYHFFPGPPFPAYFPIWYQWNYDLKLVWDVHNVHTGFVREKTTVKGLKYNTIEAESTLDTVYNKWKLTKGETSVSVAYEFVKDNDRRSTWKQFDRTFYGSDTGIVYGPDGTTVSHTYDADRPYVYDQNESFNDEYKIYDNGVTVIDFEISNVQSFGSADRMGIDYYWAYTDPSYIGLNANNGMYAHAGGHTSSADIADGFTTQPRFTIDEDGVDEFRGQYFGLPGTSAKFELNDIDGLVCYNDEVGAFGIRVPGSVHNWVTIDSTWVAESGSSWISASGSNDFVFAPNIDTLECTKAGCPIGITLSGDGVTGLNWDDVIETWDELSSYWDALTGYPYYQNGVDVHVPIYIGGALSALIIRYDGPGCHLFSLRLSG